MLPISLGSVPLILVFGKRSASKLISLPISLGMVPLTLVFGNRSSIKLLDKLPISLGNVPITEVSCAQIVSVLFHTKGNTMR